MIKRLLAFVILILIFNGSGGSAQTVEKWTGDFDQLIEYRVIRALVPYSKTYYFLDKAQPKGLTYEKLVAFEKMINKDLKKRHLQVHVVVIPTPRNELIPALVKGLGDIAAGNLTITEKRLKKIDFSDPFLTRVSEILVTGPKSPAIKTLKDLAGQKIHVRQSSSYYDSLLKLNQKFRSQGRKKIRLIKVDDFLEDEDLLEMVNAGMIPMVVVDNHKAEFWGKIFGKIRLHPDIIFRSKGEIGWAIRKKSPQLMGRINQFVKTSRKGTLLGNIMFERYLENTQYVKDPGKDSFEKTTRIFKKYAERYDFDWLLLKAVAFQESGINQKKRSPRGAVGVMQMLPSTAKDPNVNIPDIHLLDNNIHAGTKYLRFIEDRYFTKDGINDRNKTLLALAAYNAGPRQVASLRKDAIARNLNPNIWFGNVEVAAARRIGRETVQYVNNIFKYYIAYSRIYEIQDKKKGR